MAKCPSCGAQGAYLGFTSIECTWKECQHYVAPVVSPIIDDKVAYIDKLVELHSYNFISRVDGLDPYVLDKSWNYTDMGIRVATSSAHYEKVLVLLNNEDHIAFKQIQPSYNELFEKASQKGWLKLVDSALVQKGIYYIAYEKKQ